MENLTPRRGWLGGRFRVVSFSHSFRSYPTHPASRHGEMYRRPKSHDTCACTVFYMTQGAWQRQVGNWNSPNPEICQFVKSSSCPKCRVCQVIVLSRKYKKVRIACARRYFYLLGFWSVALCLMICRSGARSKIASGFVTYVYYYKGQTRGKRGRDDGRERERTINL